MIGTDKNNFQHLLLVNTQVASVHKTSLNSSSRDIRDISNTQPSKTIQLIGFLGRLLGPLMKVALPLLKNAPTLVGQDFGIIRINTSSLSS